MIRISPKPEPADFDEIVRQPGHKFLQQTPKPTDEQFEKNAYWRKCLPALWAAYGGICAYSCHHIPLDVGARNVEHFKPKKPFPEDAYEWSNYRLVCQLLNSRKRTRGILDPFSIGDDWFFVQFPSLLIHPNPDLDDDIKAKIQNTIDILRLNDEEICLLARARFISHYCEDNVKFSFLQAEAPFLARELVRQNLVDRIKNMWLSA